MANWDDLRTVAALVRGGTLAAAGFELGVTYTTVARRIARAEAALGLTLFERLADGYHPTEAARLVAEHASAMQGSADALLRQLAGRDPGLRGALVVTAPQLLIAHLLSPVLRDFTQAHPQVALEVKATNDLLDLTRREADLAIRVSRAPGDTLKGLRLAEQQTASFASEPWAERIAAAPEGPIDWIVYAGYDGLPEGIAARYPGAHVAYSFDDMVAMGGAAAAGLGVVRMPIFYGCQCRSKIPQKCRSNFPHFRDLVTSQIRGLS
jgi:DNA-binding transcriptional LysR family regulator